MFEHDPGGEHDPTRVVLIGARGFIGRAVRRELDARNIPCRSLSSREVDLTTSDAEVRLRSEIRPGDSLVMLSAITRERGNGNRELIANLRMAQAVCATLAPCAHALYVSSDAVYPFGEVPIHEASCASAIDPYGVMHRAREQMFRSTGVSLAVLRPTHVYGPGNPHDQYGPDRMLRTARCDGFIEVFGEGEDARDYIFIDDVARLVVEVLRRRSRGVLNLAAGNPIAYRTLAERIARMAGGDVEIRTAPRDGPARGRSFDLTRLREAFPNFTAALLHRRLEHA